MYKLLWHFVVAVLPNQTSALIFAVFSLAVSLFSTEVVQRHRYLVFIIFPQNPTSDWRNHALNMKSFCPFSAAGLKTFPDWGLQLVASSEKNWIPFRVQSGIQAAPLSSLHLCLTGSNHIHYFICFSLIISLYLKPPPQLI